MALGRSMLLAASVSCGDSGTGVGGTSGATIDNATTTTMSTTGNTTDEPATSATTADSLSPTSTTDTSTTVPTTTTSISTTDSSTTTDASTTTAMPACGDGHLDDGEECDDGDMEDTDECLSTCKAAKCGDGLVRDGAEDCDDGNAVDTDACTTACKHANCGDGLVWAGLEECDDGNQVDSDGCELDCRLTGAQKLIFITSQMYTGNLGGLVGADARCQQRAEAGDLPGTYMAWLSDANASPASRMTKADVRYVLPNGTKVADNWADLTDASLDAPINVTELGGPAPVGDTICAGGGFATVYTGTSASGTLSGVNDTCKDWTAEFGNARWGHADAVDNNWSMWCTSGSCSWQSPIYCVQQ